VLSEPGSTTELGQDFDNVQEQPSFLSLNRALVLVAVAMGIAANTACAAKMDALTVKRVLPAGVAHSDVERICSVGMALGVPLEAISDKAHRALIFADVSAAMCAEEFVRHAQLDAARARATMSGESMVAVVTDAKIREGRARTMAARRFSLAFQHLEDQYGEVGTGECPKIKERDEIVYLMGLFGGINSMLHDKAGGGHIGVQMDILGKVERGTVCLDDATWWHVPAAFRAASRATLLNTENGDPWEGLEAAAVGGEGTGVRLARAVQVMITANAGRDELALAALVDHGASEAKMAPNADWVLFDTYAHNISLHESDLYWTKETGHRTPTFGELPGSDAPAEDGPNPFGDDPFGDDPFGGGEEDAPEDVEGTETAPEDGAPVEFEKE
jgi:hypothetical protein